MKAKKTFVPASVELYVIGDSVVAGLVAGVRGVVRHR